MATDFQLTWRPEGRWRKKYKGKTYYFHANGQGKLASYQRCRAEWLQTKAAIDQKGYEENPHRIAWQSQIDRVGVILKELSAVDSPDSRHWWSYWKSVQDTARTNLQADNMICMTEADLADPVNIPLLIGGGSSQLDDDAPEPPPWEEVQALELAQTIRGNVDRFLLRKRQQTERGQLSHGRYESLRVSMEAFVNFMGGDNPVSHLNSGQLSAYRDHLEAQIDGKSIAAPTASGRLQAAKQFVTWAFEVELIPLPRILKSREFTIALPEKNIERFTDGEVNQILGASSPRTKLYLLLMLNCGMQQQDISELTKAEVDWKTGYITRKRSKTRKRQGENVPSVTYKLWPETFRLLKAHKSKHSTLALTNDNGDPLKTEKFVGDRVKKIDNIRSSYSRVIMKLAKSKPAIKIDKPLKLLRKTAATKLGGHSDYARFAQYFLGHAPSSIADKHYVAPSQELFDSAVAWLGEKFLADERRTKRTPK